MLGGWTCLYQWLFCQAADQELLRCSIPDSVDGPFRSGVDKIVTKNAGVFKVIGCAVLTSFAVNPLREARSAEKIAQGEGL